MSSSRRVVVEKASVAGSGDEVVDADTICCTRERASMSSSRRSFPGFIAEMSLS